MPEELPRPSCFSGRQRSKIEQPTYYIRCLESALASLAGISRAQLIFVLVHQ